MKRILTTVFAILMISASLHSQERAVIHNVQTPVVTDRPYNILAEITIGGSKDGLSTLKSVDVIIDGIEAKAIRNIRLMYSGGMSVLATRRECPVMNTRRGLIGAGDDTWYNPDYIMECSRVNKVKAGEPVRLVANKLLFPKRCSFYLSMEIDSRKVRDFAKSFKVEITGITIDGKFIDGREIRQKGPTDHRLGINIANGGIDGTMVYRIPGIIKSNDGTLIAVYDIRYDSMWDLQSNIDIGIRRSTDGGRTWSKEIIAMDMGEWGGLPEGQNGIGDPAILVDRQTGEIFISAIWMNGPRNSMSWTGVGRGMAPHETGQIMIASSKDDGKTWSEPLNITPQVKQPEWAMTLQGPGMGITLEDGTLVFAFQYTDIDDIIFSGVMYSKDHGKTWHTHAGAVPKTSEAQVVQLGNGDLMLNMRNQGGKGRRVAVTSDLGRTWQLHESDKTLDEPVCMGSLIRVKGEDNITGKDILLFSNPANTKQRTDITIKASLDEGKTWKECDSILLDEEEGWGYSCLTMIDRETVGILYESSTTHLVFQAVKLTDLINSGR